MKRTILLTILIFTMPISLLANTQSSYKFEVEKVERDDLNSLIILTSSALHAWNPSFSSNEIELFLSKKHNLEITPHILNAILVMIDLSYIVAEPQFADILTPIIAGLSPKLAEHIFSKMGHPTHFQKTLNEITRSPYQDIENGFLNQLGNWNQKSLTFTSKVNEPIESLEQILFGPSSLFAFKKNGGKIHHNKDNFDQISVFYSSNNIKNNFGINQNSDVENFYPKNRERIYDPTRGGINSTPIGKENNEYQQGGPSKPRIKGNAEQSPKGPFSNLDIVAMSDQCLSRCIDDVVGIGAGGATIGGAIGGPAGAAGGAVIGGALGGVKCSVSSDCKDSDKDKDKDKKNLRVNLRDDLSSPTQGVSPTPIFKDIVINPIPNFHSNNKFSEIDFHGRYQIVINPIKGHRSGN